MFFLDVFMSTLVITARHALVIGNSHYKSALPKRLSTVRLLLYRLKKYPGVNVMQSTYYKFEISSLSVVLKAFSCILHNYYNDNVFNCALVTLSKQDLEEIVDKLTKYAASSCERIVIPMNISEWSIYGVFLLCVDSNLPSLSSSELELIEVLTGQYCDSVDLISNT